jgi:hypothetical protein
VRTALKQPGPAAAAHREAYNRAEADIEVLKGFTQALLADTKWSTLWHSPGVLDAMHQEKLA